MKLYKAVGRHGQALRYFSSPVTHAVDLDGEIEQFFASRATARDFAFQKTVEGHDAIVVIATPHELGEQANTPSPRVSFSERLDELFGAVPSPDGTPYTPEDLADALQKEGVPLAERVVGRLLAGIGGPPPATTVAAIARFFGVEPGFLAEDAIGANSSSYDREPLSHGAEGRAVGVYAKARNNDPAVPFNSRTKPFKSGRGFAVDIRVRDYHGFAAQRYAEGVIIGFWESEAKARRVAEEVNSGRRFGPGHELHDRAHSAIVVPAWNASDFPGDKLPWETEEGSAGMVAAYESAGVPIPQWLSTIIARFDGDAGPTTVTSTAKSITCDENTLQSDQIAPAMTIDSLGVSNSRADSLDGELLELILNAVEVGGVIWTLGAARPNRIVSIEATGIRVATEKSELKGKGPQLVPAWMVAVAWDHLRRHGSLTQKYLLNKLNVKRSAFVCALLSRLPNVEFDTVPHVTLSFVEAATSSLPDPGRHSSEDELEHASSQQSSRPVDANSQRATSGSVETDEYASRLNRLFDTVHPDDRGPYSNEEVAESLQMDGIPLHANSISRLRESVGGPPDERVTHALAYFFNVDPEYFFGGIDLNDVIPEAHPTLTADEEPVEREADSAAAALREAKESAPATTLSTGEPVGPRNATAFRMSMRTLACNEGWARRDEVGWRDDYFRDGVTVSVAYTDQDFIKVVRVYPSAEGPTALLLEIDGSDKFKRLTKLFVEGLPAEVIERLASTSKHPPPPADTGIRMSTVDLLRTSAGLSRAAHSASSHPPTDFRLVRRLVALIAEVGTFLQASVSGDVLVPIRYLEHVVAEWDATGPSDNGTEPDYRWLAELLNRHIDD